MLGPEFMTQNESKARLKNEVLVVTQSANRETEEGHRRKAEKNKGGYGSSTLPFKIGKPQGKIYPEYLKGESGAHFRNTAFLWVWSTWYNRGTWGNREHDNRQHKQS